VSQAHVEVARVMMSALVNDPACAALPDEVGRRGLGHLEFAVTGRAFPVRERLLNGVPQRWW